MTKISASNDGVWINRDSKNDVHIHAENSNRIILAINDEAVYSGKSPCQLALSMENDKIYLQVRHSDGYDNVTFHDVSPAVVDALLRGVLTTLAASVLK